MLVVIKLFALQALSVVVILGEKGLYKPEINAVALRNIKKLIPVDVKEGYYANRMCEVGLTQHSGVPYRHLAYLLEECTR